MVKLFTLLALIILTTIGFVYSQTVISPTVDIFSISTDFNSKALLDIENVEPDFAALKENTSTFIRWKNKDHHIMQDLSLIYLHGFTGFRTEISPFVENLQDELNANAYFARIAGHGFKNSKIENVGIKNWLADADKAYLYANVLGKKHIYIALSTGAELAVYLAKKYHDNSCLIFFSPNFGLKTNLSLIGTGVLGPFFLKNTIGAEFSLAGSSSLSERIDSPIVERHTLSEFLEMTKSFREMSMSDLKNPILVVYSEDDQVVDIQKIHEKYVQINSSAKKEFKLASGGHLLYQWNDKDQIKIPLKYVREFISEHCL